MDLLDVDLPLKPLHSGQHHTSTYLCLGHHRLPQQLEPRPGSSRLASLLKRKSGGRARELRSARRRRSLVEIDMKIGKRRSVGSDDVGIRVGVEVGIEIGIEVRTRSETRIGMKTGRDVRRRSVESVSVKRTKGTALSFKVSNTNRSGHGVHHLPTAGDVKKQNLSPRTMLDALPNWNNHERSLNYPCTLAPTTHFTMPISAKRSYGTKSARKRRRPA
jgi:hypothetical protein